MNPVSDLLRLVRREAAAGLTLTNMLGNKSSSAASAFSSASAFETRKVSIPIAWAVGLEHLAGAVGPKGLFDLLAVGQLRDRFDAQQVVSSVQQSR